MELMRIGLRGLMTEESEDVDSVGQGKGKRIHEVEGDSGEVGSTLSIGAK